VPLQTRITSASCSDTKAGSVGDLCLQFFSQPIPKG